MSNRVVILIPWYGPYPSFFEYFLQGCKRNSNILDIKIFTTNQWDKPLPQNIEIIHLEINELEALFFQKTNLKVNLDFVYKLCDFKPLYGKVFEDYVKNYDFWGYGDIDTIYGDLTNYLSDDLLNKYDVFSFREYLISGGFSIFKNIPELNELYSKSKDIETVCNSTKYMGFDEAGGKMEQCRKLIPPNKLLHIDNFECWSYLIYDLIDKSSLALRNGDYMRESLRFNSKIIISDEIKAYDDYDRYAIYHMVTEKRTSIFKIPKNIKTEPYIIVSETGIYNPSTYKNWYWLLHNYRKGIGLINKFIQRIKDSFKYRFKK